MLELGIRLSLTTPWNKIDYLTLGDHVNLGLEEDLLFLNLIESRSLVIRHSNSSQNLINSPWSNTTLFFLLATFKSVGLSRATRSKHENR